MELGPKIGEGGASEVFLWGDAQVVKLVREGFDARVAEYELRVTQQAYEAGAPAPRVYGLIEIDGRSGVILERYDGTSLLDNLLAGKVTPAVAGKTMAHLLADLHVGRYATKLLTFRAWVRLTLSALVSDGLPADAVDKVRSTVEDALPEAGVLCHCDLHPGNVLLTATGAKMIDWTSALNADPMVDVARQHLSFTVLPQDPTWDAPRRAADEALIAAYADLTGVTRAALLARVEPYMAVMAAMRMVESTSTKTEKMFLLDYIRSTN